MFLFWKPSVLEVVATDQIVELPIPASNGGEIEPPTLVSEFVPFEVAVPFGENFENPTAELVPIIEEALPHYSIETETTLPSAGF